MKNRMKYPLAIFVVWHPNFKQGKRIANNLYSTFCRDVEQPLSRGIGIPVYYRSASLAKEPIPINTDGARRNAIVLLIDENYFIDSNIRNYTQSLLGLVDANTRIFPIALCKQAYEIGLGLDSYQFIKAWIGDLSVNENLLQSMRLIRSALLHDCARLTMNLQPTRREILVRAIPSPVKLFLSHAKKDGLEISKQFKAFVDAEFKLDVFFDTVDIADGYEFQRQIEENIKNSALVVFHTDEYSAREWCRIEVLVAKRNKCPMVVVHDIKHGEKRAFPYLGNAPTITLQSNKRESFREIVDITLYQVLNKVFQRELLESFHKKFKSSKIEFILITSPPELFNYLDFFKKRRKIGNKLVVLYPEPPLGMEELRILNEIDDDIVFITPIYLPTLV